MRAVRRVAGVALLLCVGAGAAALVVSQRIDEPYQGFSGSEQFVEVPPGTGTNAIGRRLIDAGVVRDDMTFRLALWWTGRSRALQAGEYRFDRPASPREVVERLARGDVYARRITFPEGLTIEEMAALYESRGFGEGAEFVAAARDGSLVGDIEAAAADLEGFLFPET